MAKTNSKKGGSSKDKKAAKPKPPAINDAFLNALLTTPSPTGREAPLQDKVEAQVKPFADKVIRDSFGNLTAIVNEGGSPRVMLAGHADEIGMQIKYIDDKGFLWINALGGIDTSVYTGRQVDILAKGGVVAGVLGKRPIHLMTAKDLEKAPELAKMWIDIGATDGDDAKKRVSIGDPVVLKSELFSLGGSLRVSRAFDDKAGVYVVMEAARLAKEYQAKAEIYAVATAQEEIGTRGAIVSSYQSDAGIGFAVDVSFATDYPGEDKKLIGEFKLGGGPIVTRGPNINPKLFDYIIATAEKHHIPVQIHACPRPTGTDARSMQLARGGMAVGLISIPLRYMHTPVETISLDDLALCVELLARCITGLDKTTSFAL